MVAGSISPKGEMICNAQQGDGEAHSTHDVKDSITFIEGRRLTVCKLVPKQLESFHILIPPYVSMEE